MIHRKHRIPEENSVAMPQYVENNFIKNRLSSQEHMAIAKKITLKNIVSLGSVDVSHGQPKQGAGHGGHTFVIAFELVKP
jgi:hypothetical protein